MIVAHNLKSLKLQTLGTKNRESKIYELVKSRETNARDLDQDAWTMNGESSFADHDISEIEGEWHLTYFHKIQIGEVKESIRCMYKDKVCGLWY